MNILFCRWNSICERGITNAFERLKIPMIYLDRRFTHVDYDNSYVEELSNILMNNHDISAVFSVNFIPVISRVCNLFKITYFCWIVDSPCFQLYSETLKFETNKVFIFDRTLYEQFVKINPRNIYYHPLGTDTDTWDEIRVTKEDHRNYDCDVSFIGSLYSEKCQYNKIESQLPEYIRGYCEGLIASTLKVRGYNLLNDSIDDAFAQEFKKYAQWPKLGEDYTEDTAAIVADTFLGEKCTEQDRIYTLNEIGRHFSVDLYTLSDTTLLKSVNIKGGADSLKMMPKIIKCSKINLNMTSIPIKTGLPLRIFDILGMGGFLISNYQAEIPEYFDAGNDIVLYESVPQLIELIDFYLKNPDERERIAYNGYIKVKSNHTYDIKITQMLRMILGSTTI